MRTVLTIAGSDSIGGAGAQADLKAIASLDLHGASALTAITAQNTQRVARIVPLSVDDIIAQIDAVLDDADVASIKTGMLYSGEIAKAIAERLKNENIPIVIDPVLIAGIGDRLCSDGLVGSIKKDLIPMATVLTPNRQEAETLTGLRIDDLESARKACEAIGTMGVGSVLIKGGHFEGNGVIDVLYSNGRFTEYTAPRWPTKVHGAGCTLASFIAGNIAKGMDVRSSVLDAKRRITDAIALSYPIGEGMNAINPMATKQKEAMRGDRIESLRSMMDKLQESLSSSWVPSIGGGFVYALPAPQSFSEVCGIEGGFSPSSRRLKKNGEVRFDVSRELASVVMGISIFDVTKTAVLTLKGTERNIEALKRSGMMWANMDLGLGRNSSSKVAKAITEGIEQTGFVPEIIFDKWGMGAEPMIFVIGRTPAEILRRIGPILR